MGLRSRIGYFGMVGLFVVGLMGCQGSKAVDAKGLCENLHKKGVADNCKPADAAQNGVTRKEAMQFTVKFADEIAYGGQVMVFNTPGDLDAYKQAADEKQREYIKANKLESLADRQMPRHFENRERLLLVTLLPGPAVGKVDVKLKEISGVIAAQ